MNHIFIGVFMKFKPLHDRVLIEVLDGSEKTAAGFSLRSRMTIYILACRGIYVMENFFKYESCKKVEIKYLKISRKI